MRRKIKKYEFYCMCVCEVFENIFARDEKIPTKALLKIKTY